MAKKRTLFHPGFEPWLFDNPAISLVSVPIKLLGSRTFLRILFTILGGFITTLMSVYVVSYLMRSSQNQEILVECLNDISFRSFELVFGQ